MLEYIKKIFWDLVFIIILVLAAFINWWFPLYLKFGDTPVIRFIWLGIFFVLLDILLEVISKIIGQFNLIGEKMSLGKDIKKISDSFRVATNVLLPSNLRADFIIVGSSGVWLLMVKDNKGRIEFNGDDIVQNGVIQRGLLTKTLEMGYTFASLLKHELGRDIIVTPVVVFSSPQANLESVPKIVHGVYLVSYKNAVSLIEDTDIQLIDKNTIEEIYKILKK